MTLNRHVNPNTVYGAVLGYENGSMPASLKKHPLVVKNSTERYAKRGQPVINAVLAVGELGELEQLAEDTHAVLFSHRKLKTDGTDAGPGYYATMAREQLDPKLAVLDYWMR